MKIKPHSLESEQSLLGALLIDNKIIPQVLDILNIDDFYQESHKYIYEWVIKVFKKWLDVDIITLREELNANKTLEIVWGVTYISELLDICPTSSSWDSYTHIIKENSTKRKIIGYTNDIQRLAFDDSQESKDILESVEKISKYIFKLQTKKEESDYSYYERFIDLRDLYIKNWGKFWFDWPYKQIDKHTKGFMKWKTYTLAGFSNIGKSKFMYSFICDFLKKGKKVLIFSLEVDKWLLFANLYTCMQQINFWKVFKDDYLFWDTLNVFENLEIIDDVYNLQDIKTICKIKNPDICFIDFVQNIQTKATSEYEKMTLIAQELQLLWISTGITMFNISQISNEGRFKKWDEINLKWSWALFASSDVILILWKENQTLKLTIAKNKFGKNGVEYDVSVDFETAKFNLFEIETQNNF